MRQGMGLRRRWTWLLRGLAGLGLSLAAACDLTPTPTPPVPLLPTPTIALPPSPPIVSVPLETVEPWPTPAVGPIRDLGCYPRVHRGEAQFDSCWYTRVSGAWFLVGAGYEGFTPDDIHGALADEITWRGLIWVSDNPYGAPLDNQRYPAPRPDLHIIAVDGPRITLAARDPAVPDTFVFDITTFQWVKP